jgi:deoxyxylulose-5-phosphate synthase
MAFEAMNNAGVTPDIDLLVVLNDNDMSISPPVGALNKYLARMLSGRQVTMARDMARSVLSKVPPVYELARRLEEHAKGMVVPATMFEEFGFTYFGPIDGHDVDALVKTLANVKALPGPQLLHVITKKGYGYARAEDDPILYHGVTKFDPAEVLRVIEEQKITATMLVPSMIYALMDHPDSHTRDLSSLETVYYGASAMNPVRLAEAIRRFGPIFAQYDSTGANAVAVLTAGGAVVAQDRLLLPLFKESIQPFTERRGVFRC